MLFIPLLVLLGAKFLNIDPNVAVPTILQAAMPPMVTGVILLINADIAARFSATVLGFGTLAAAITLPFWFYLTAQFFQ